MQMLRASLLKHEKDYAEKHFELEFKAVGYLLTAHGAGLAGCLALLKDYANTPNLKGLGLFIACFGIGFLAAIIAFMAAQYFRSQVMSVFLDGAPDKANIQSMVRKALLPQVASVAALVIGIVGLVLNFSKL
jgi:hypothetical protein